MTLRGLYWLVLVLLALGLGVDARANVHLDAIGQLPLPEQYRQLSLMLLVSAGAAPALTQGMAALAPAQAEGPGFNPDDYTTPLARIVDQETMLDGAAQLFRFARDHHEAVRTALDAIETAQPGIANAAVSAAITSDAIIIRNAIADSMQMSERLAVGNRDELVRDYRVHTIYLRNVMEYESFSDELAVLTDEAIQSVGGKLDAYQRMFDEETGSSTFDRHIDAAESIYLREIFDMRAGELTDEMIRDWVLSESQPNR